MQVTPKGDLVLCKVGDAEDKTTGGVLLPESAQKKPTSGKDDWCCLHVMVLPENSALADDGLGSSEKLKACPKASHSSDTLHHKRAAWGSNSSTLAGTAAALVRITVSFAKQACCHLQGTAHRAPALHSGVRCCEEAGKCCVSHRPQCLWLQGTLCQSGMAVWGT